MRGYKTWTAGAALMLPGLAQIGLALLAAKDGSGLDINAMQSGITMFGAGLGVVGIGHKIEKAGDLISSQLNIANTIQKAVTTNESLTNSGR